MKGPGALLATAEGPAGRLVPPTGFTARLVIVSAAAMAFLAVLALALGVAAGRLAGGWDAALADTATVRVAAPEAQLAAQTEAVLEVLRTTAGVASARVLDAAETQALLAPWFGPDLPLADLPLPRLIAVTTAPEGFDAAGLQLRLSAETPGAVLDDHGRWRAPLATAAARLRAIAATAGALTLVTLAAVVVLAAQSALAAHAQVIEVLRLVGARDAFIARAFVRRFTLRALGGALAGTALGLAAAAFLPDIGAALGLPGATALGAGAVALALAVPPVVAVLAFLATHLAVRVRLKEIT
ncbi:MAG: cell division protein FtsX [Rhodobacteraceae bacterium]|nr:cell division protein FtsX [Paracoccaceae bacterium]